MKTSKTSQKIARRAAVAAGTVEDYVSRSLDRARKLDRGERLPAEITMTFENPADLIRVLSTERIRVLRAVRAKSSPVAELAMTLHRDRKAVRRDVSILASFGLVDSREEANPGHGRRKIIAPRAAKYQLRAVI